MKEVCVYDDTYDLVMSFNLDKDKYCYTFAYNLFNLIEDYGDLLRLTGDADREE